MQNGDADEQAAEHGGYRIREPEAEDEAGRISEIMEEVIPWDEWTGLVETYYPSGKRGRSPRGVETMLRMYLLANWFNLSDEEIEDAIYDSYAFRKFMRVDFLGDEQVPDATTLCKFRKLLNDKGITKLLFDTMKSFLDRHGKLMHGGTIVDATIIEAPTSTKNADQRRDPEMHQVKKGNEWHFGERMHIGVDAGTGYIHSVELTAANVSKREIVPQLIRPDDEVVYGDAGYTGLAKHPEFQADLHLASIDYRINTRNRLHWKSQAPGFDWDRHMEYQKSRIRSKLEYAFLIIKRLFGYRKVRYRGLEKIKPMRLSWVPAPTYSCWRNSDGAWVTVLPKKAVVMPQSLFGRSPMYDPLPLAFLALLRPLIGDYLGNR